MGISVTRRSKPCWKGSCGSHEYGILNSLCVLNWFTYLRDITCCVVSVVGRLRINPFVETPVDSSILRSDGTEPYVVGGGSNFPSIIVERIEIRDFGLQVVNRINFTTDSDIKIPPFIRPFRDITVAPYGIVERKISQIGILDPKLITEMPK